jgi:hypothetical protein
MARRIRLVQNDSQPPLVLSLTEEASGDPLDFSDAGDVVRLKIRAVGATTLQETVVGTKLTGLLKANGTVDTTAPYNVAGAGGRVSFSWSGNDALTGDPGRYEGELQITYNDTTVQTAYEELKFTIREEF